MRIISNMLLSIAWFIGLAIGLLLLMMVMGNEAAIWIGGWGLLFFGLPLLAVWLLCVSVGKSLRKRVNTGETQVVERKPDREKYLAWFAFLVGVLLLIYFVFEVVFLHFHFVPLGYDALLDTGQPVPSNAWLLFVIALFDIKLALAIAAIAYGVTRLQSKD